jgi:hypothetical protein
MYTHLLITHEHLYGPLVWVSPCQIFLFSRTLLPYGTSDVQICNVVESSPGITCGGVDSRHICTSHQGTTGLFYQQLTEAVDRVDRLESSSWIFILTDYLLSQDLQLLE